MSAQGLPAHILTLFGPRPPAEPIPKSQACQQRPREITGCGEFVSQFGAHDANPPKKERYVPPRQRRVHRLRDKWQAHMKKLQQLRAEYDPHALPITTDPLRTLFVGRISYDTSEKKLRREFEQYGPVNKLKMIFNTVTGKPRGYAFVEFDDERHAKVAYKQADGRKIDGRRVLVDVERGRASTSWFPRRLGGGRGSGRKLKGAKAEALWQKIMHGGDKDRDRGRDRDRGGDKDKDRDRGRDRDRDRGGDKDRDRGGDKDRDRGGDKDRDRGGDKDKDRTRDRDRDRGGDKDRERDRDRERERKRE